MVLRLLGVIRSRYVLLILMAGVVFAMVTAGAYLRREKFESTALLFVNLGQRTVSISRSDIQLIEAQAMAVEVITSQAEILGSYSLAEGVVEKLGLEAFNAEEKRSKYQVVNLARDMAKGLSQWGKQLLIKMKHRPQENPTFEMIKRVRKNLKVFPVRRTQVIELSYKDKNPKIPKKVLDALLELYLNKNQTLQDQFNNYDFFFEQSQHYKEMMETAEKKFADFKLKYSIIDIEAERRSLMERRNDILVRLENTQLASGSSVSDSQTKKLTEQLVELELRRSKLLSDYSSSHKTVSNIDRQIALINKHIKTEQKTLKEKVAGYDKRLALVTEIEPQYNRLLRDVKSWQEAYEVYSKASEDRRLSKMQPSRVNIQIVDPPRGPLEPVGPTRLTILGLGFVFSWIVGLLSIVFVEWFLSKPRDRMANKRGSPEEAIAKVPPSQVPESES